MCLILFAYKMHPTYQLIVAANRDEFYKRRTAPVHYWEDNPEIIAGRDLEKMGTWMGVIESGRFAALTNYRDPSEKTEGKRSRGELVADALQYDGDIQKFMLSLGGKNDLYPGYNLLVGDINDLYYYSNIGQQLEKLSPGVYGISNHLLNSEWPKVKLGINSLSQIINNDEKNIEEQLFSLLQTSDPFPDELLPQTGVSLEWERLLSALFIKSENYGTRSSTVLLMKEDKIEYVERVFNKEKVNEQRYNIERVSDEKDHH